MSDEEHTCLVVSADGKVERMGVPEEPMMVPSRIAIIVGQERFVGFIEGLEVWTKDPHCDRLNLKLLIPEKDDEIRNRLVAGLKEASVGKPEQEPQKMSLNEAIEHAESIALEGGCCAGDHEQLATWLTELKHLRTRARGLFERLESLQKEFREFRRKAATSLDDNVHIRVEISQWSKRWMGAIEISNEALKYIRMGEGAMMLEQGTRLLQETIGGFLVERERRGWEP